MQLVEHIEILLSEYPCISIPGFGGFVVQEIDARFIDDTLYPPSLELSFNRDLSHNDGLLVSQVSRTTKLNTMDASLWIKEEVEGFQKRLFEYKQILFGRIGVLSVNEEGGVVFHNNKENLLFHQYFGLTPLEMKAIKEECPIEVNEAKLTEPLHEPVVLDLPQIHRPYFKIIASVAAALLFFFFSTPSLIDSKSPQTASIFFDNFKFVSDTAAKLVDSMPKQEEIAIDTPVEKVVIPEEQEVEFIPNGRFCVVVMSCPTLKSAEREIVQRKSILDSVMIVEGDGRFRVVVMQTNSRSKANKCIDYYKNKGLESTWLYVTQ